MHRTRSETDGRTVQLLYAFQSSFGGIKNNFPENPTKKVEIQNFEPKKWPEPKYVWKYQSTPPPPFPLDFLIGARTQYNGSELGGFKFTNGFDQFNLIFLK